MKKISEISRRSMYHEVRGIACGPIGLTVIDAEIVVDVDDQRVFLHGQWIDEVGDQIHFEAHKESIYDAYEKLITAMNDEEEEKSLAERDRIDKGRIKSDSIFKPFYEELKQMIIDEMEAHDIENYFDDEDVYEEDEDDEEVEE